MTGPRIDPTSPAPRVLTGPEWAAAQSAPASALLSDDPAKATTSGLGRPLTGAEWNQAQRMTAEQVKTWRIPAIPVPVASGDATRRLNPNSGAPDRDLTEQAADALLGSDIGKSKGIAGFLTRQILAPIVEHPIMTAATIVGAEGAAAISPLLGLAAGTAFLGQAVSIGAQYGWQKVVEHGVDPETRKLMEADPDRISGEFAAGQALMLGLGPLIHVGVRGISRASDVSAGLMEAGVRGVKETNLAPRFSDDFATRQDISKFTAMFERGAEEPLPSAIRAPKGFEPTASPAPSRGRVKPTDGLVVPEAVKPGRVKAIDTEPASAPLQEAADVNAARREYEARRVTEDAEDVAAARLADAERLLGLRDDEAASLVPRRRPGGRIPGPFFETPQGAEVLGAMAARHGLPTEANPYHPASRLAPEWETGHQSASESHPLYPEGFTMGGALTESRIPADVPVPKLPGFEPTQLPEGVDVAALTAAFKPSRFRGHSIDELLTVARSARETVDRAQSVLDGEHVEPAAATSADRAITRANGMLVQAEREFALRGLTGDELARRISEPAEGTGPTRTRGLSAGVAQKALVNRLELTVGDLPEYRTLSMADQAERAAALIADDPSLAIRVAKGEASPPHGLEPEAVFVAVENKATLEGDVTTLREIATGRLTGEATRMGQRIRLLAERDPDSPVSAIQDVINTRSGGAKNAEKVLRATDEEVGAMTKHLEGVSVKSGAWAKLLDDLRC